MECKRSHFRLVLMGIDYKTFWWPWEMQKTRGNQSWARYLQSSAGPLGLERGYFKIRNMFFGNVPIFWIWSFHNYFLCFSLFSHFLKTSTLNHNNKIKKHISICIYKYKKDVKSVSVGSRVMGRVCLFWSQSFSGH